MNAQRADTKRKKEIIDICLEQFIENGLFKTSIRDLSNALHMQQSALYYHFKGKDEIVLACAEEASIRLEDALIAPVFDCLNDLKDLMSLSRQKTAEMAPMMRFFTQVCTTKRYQEDVQPLLERLRERHTTYSVRFAKELNCEPEEIAPYLYACVAIVSNYMIFGEKVYFTRPLELIGQAIQEFKERQVKKNGIAENTR